MTALDYGADYRLRVMHQGEDRLTPVLDHLDLLAESGVPLTRVAEVTGLDYSGLHRLRSKSPTKITRRSADLILAVQPTDATGTGRVPGERLEHALTQLEAKGWTRNQVGRALGLRHAPVPGATVRLETLWQVRSLLDQPPRAHGVVVDAATVQRARQSEDAQRDKWTTAQRASRERRGVAREEATMDESWRDRARCKTMDPAVFFPAETDFRLQRQAEARAAAVCEQCPVRVECKAYARDTRQADGVWGGEHVIRHKRGATA